MKGVVYFIVCGDLGRVKIGFTRGSPMKRLKSLQTGSPCKLMLMAFYTAPPDEERRLHREFDKFRVSGEWFEMDDEIFDFIVCTVIFECLRGIRDRGEPPKWANAVIQKLKNDGILDQYLEVINEHIADDNRLAAKPIALGQDGVAGSC